MQSDKWRADFDENGKARLKFTYLSYLQMDSPQDITVFSKETGRAVGTINFPAGSLKPGEESSIPFNAENVSLIHAKGVGDTTITFMDEWGNYQEVYVVVTESGYAPGSVNFKVYTVYECSDVIVRSEKNYAIGEKPNGEVKADFYTGDYGIWRIDIRPVNSISGGTTYQRMNESDPKLYRYNWGGGGMNTGGFITSNWLENVSHSGFTWVFHNVVSNENGWYTEVHDVYVP